MRTDLRHRTAREGQAPPLHYDERRGRKNRNVYYSRFFCSLQLFLEQKFLLLYPGGGMCIMGVKGGVGLCGI